MPIPEAPSRASTLSSTKCAMYTIPQKSFARSNLPVYSSPLASSGRTPRELRFWPAKSSLLGRISEPDGRPSCVGGYSDVWRCGVRFSTASEALPTEVAVKVLRPVWLQNCCGPNASNARLLLRFQQEAITWVGLDHPNIVPLIGWTLAPSLSFISPRYKKGNLYGHLKNLSEIEKLRVLLGIARGLEYLHSRWPPIAHGDLKPENILLSDRGEPLLTDFGLSTMLGEEGMYTSSHSGGGSTAWMSPECMTGTLKSCQSDIYSFGSLAFTVMTGILPHAGLNHNQITLKVCNNKDPKDPVEDWRKYPQLQGLIKDLLKGCWSHSPNARPPMSAVIQRLTSLLESYESGIQAVSSEPDPNMGLKLIWLLVSAIIFTCMAVELCNWTIS